MLKQFLFLSIAALSSTQVFATDFECDRGQKHCVTDDRNMTVGDRIGVFNGRNELVAYGRVKTMEGSQRSIKINHSYGRIYQKHRLALLDSDIRKAAQVEKRYDLYTPKAKRTFGVDVGLASVSVGSILSGMEASAYGAWSVQKKFRFSLRTTMMDTEGEISRDHSFFGWEKSKINVFSASLIPGLSTTFREKDLLSFRGEIGAGLAYVAAQIDGRSDYVTGEGYDAKVSNGFGLALRGSLEAHLNFKPIRVKLVGARQILHHANTSSLSIGVAKDFR